MRRGAPRGEQGSSVVEFVLLTTVLVLLLFVVLQIAVWFYARNIVAAAAADAAHYSATVGATPTAGQRRARQLMAGGLSARVAGDIRCSDASGSDPGTGLPTTTVRCQGRPHMVLLPFELPLRIDVHSSALTEGQP
jgi:Flp pilus assembly protein TadG